MRYAYLLFVSAEANHNKFYEMKQVSEDNWEANFGRVGANKPQHATYNISQWDSKYREKIKKGYRDRTDEHIGTGEEKLLSQKVLQVGRHLPIEDKSVNDVVTKLISVSAQVLKENYTVELNNVTQYMLEGAQKRLNNLYTIYEEFEKQSKPDEAVFASLNEIWDKIPAALKRQGINDERVNSVRIKTAGDVRTAYYIGCEAADRYKSSLSQTVYKNMINNLQLLHSNSLAYMKKSQHMGESVLIKFNNELVELFNILPRKMRNVVDYLAPNTRYMPNIIKREQNLYDTMKGAYDTKKRQMQLSVEKIKNTNEGITVLEENGLRMRPCTSVEVEEIKKLLGEISGKFSKAWAVENITTADKYKKCVKQLDITSSGVKKLWHGSTTENWWSILTNGLSLNPNARITGKMFGNGIYFAPKAKKSLGYTSIRGSYWARGGDSVGYMGVFDVACGKPWDVHSSNGRFHNFGFKDLRGGCTYVYAHAGQVLRNDEIIVYRDDQLTIRYLVELRG